MKPGPLGIYYLDYSPVPYPKSARKLIIGYTKKEFLNKLATFSDLDTCTEKDFKTCANNIQSEKTVGATETTQTVEPETAAFWEETEPLSIHIGSTWGSKKTYSITKDAITVSIQDFDGESGVVGIY